MATHILTIDEVASMSPASLKKEMAWQQTQYEQAIQSKREEAINTTGENITLLGIKI